MGCEKPQFIFADKMCKFCYNKEQLKKPKKTTQPNPRIKKKKVGVKKVAKPKTVSTLKKKVWRIFSWYIRLRDSDDQGYCYCFTSGKRMHWKDAQAGHFVSRKYNNTLYHERNVHAQSPYDNCHLSGNQYIYGKNLDIKYGPGTADDIVALSRLEKKFSPEELEQMFTHYSNEVKKLLIQKNLK